MVEEKRKAAYILVFWSWISSTVRIRARVFFKNNASHDGLVKQIQCKASRRQAVMMTFKNCEGFLEQIDRVKTVRVPCFQTTHCQDIAACTREYLNFQTYPWRSFAAFLERTVFPISTISLRIRWFWGSASVDAVLNISRDIRLRS